MHVDSFRLKKFASQPYYSSESRTRRVDQKESNNCSKIMVYHESVDGFYIVFSLIYRNVNFSTIVSEGM